MIKEYQLSEPIPLPEFTDMLLDLADLIESKVEVEMLSKKLGLPYIATKDGWIRLVQKSTISLHNY